MADTKNIKRRSDVYIDDDKTMAFRTRPLTPPEPPPLPPYAQFSGAPLFGIAPLLVNFTDLSTGDPTAWAWTFGDTGTSVEQNPSHTYANPGIYSVGLHVTAPSGADDRNKPNYITVNAPPVGKWVAVAASGTGNRVMTSPDGLTWTLQTSAADYAWRKVVQKNGRWVAVADSPSSGNRIMTSEDTVTWTSQTDPSPTAPWNSVACSHNIWVAVAHGNWPNNLMTSPDGYAWTLRSNSYGMPTVARGVVWAPALSKFVCVGSSGTANERIATSPDGITWTIQPAPAVVNDLRDVIYGGELFVAVGGTLNNDTAGIITSPDGITWTQRTHPFGSGNHVLTGAAYSPQLGLFVVVGQGSGSVGMRICTSKDAITWTACVVPYNDGGLRAIGWNGERFVAVGDNGTGRIVTSTDGITWTMVPAPSTYVWDSICWSDRDPIFFDNFTGPADASIVMRPLLIETNPAANYWVNAGYTSQVLSGNKSVLEMQVRANAISTQSQVTGPIASLEFKFRMPDPVEVGGNIRLYLTSYLEMQIVTFKNTGEEQYLVKLPYNDFDQFQQFNQTFLQGTFFNGDTAVCRIQVDDAIIRFMVNGVTVFSRAHTFATDTMHTGQGKPTIYIHNNYSGDPIPLPLARNQQTEVYYVGADTTRDYDYTKLNNRSN